MKTNHNYDNTRNRILEAAEKQFLNYGYDSTRLEDIVREARVSKTAIYKIFGGKRELFLALNETMIDGLIKKIKSLSTLNTHTFSDIRSSLIIFGNRYINALLQEHRLSLFRLNLSIATRFQDAAKNYYKSGPQVIQDSLSDFFKDAHEKKLLCIPNATFAASQFMALIRGNDHIHALLEIGYRPDDTVLSDYVESSVTLFLNGYKITS